jgi:lipoyl(octanoyl) transferase
VGISAAPAAATRALPDNDLLPRGALLRAGAVPGAGRAGRGVPMTMVEGGAGAAARRLRVEWLGRRPYAEVYARMGALLEARLAGEAPDTLLLCEHEPVFTLGRSRSAKDNVLDAGDIPVVEVERGGDVTFHGPGQLVGYPVLQLPPHRQDLRAYLRGLEALCGAVLRRFGVEGGSDPRNTGVWVGGQKIAAIGVAARRWVTWHGFAINVDVDLSSYQRINPCGMGSALVTRLADHVEPCPRVRVVADATAAEARRWWARWSAPPLTTAEGGVEDDVHGAVLAGGASTGA